MLLHVEMSGQGEAIVFLHTGLNTGASDFRYHQDYFSDRYKIMAPDLRGHGKSSVEDYSNFFEESAKDLAETLTHYEIGSAHIVGASLGAIVAIKFATMFPHLVKTLTVSGVIIEEPKEGIKENYDHLLQNEQAIAYFDRLHDSNWRELIKMAQNEDWYPYEDTRKIVELEVPVLFIVGEGLPHEVKGVLKAKEMNGKINVAVVPFSGHLIHAEQPSVHAKFVEVLLEKYCGDIG